VALFWHFFSPIKINTKIVNFSPRLIFGEKLASFHSCSGGQIKAQSAEEKRKKERKKEIN